MYNNIIRTSTTTATHSQSTKPATTHTKQLPGSTPWRLLVYGNLSRNCSHPGGLRLGYLGYVDPGSCLVCVSTTTATHSQSTKPATTHTKQLPGSTYPKYPNRSCTLLSRAFRMGPMIRILIKYKSRHLHTLTTKIKRSLFLSLYLGS
jgi:hypothetical protein